MFECKVCKVMKVRNKSKIYAAQSSSKHVDEAGRTWNGRACPDCRNDAQIAKIREAAVSNGQTTTYTLPKLRPCKSCGVKNVNYFQCSPCLSLLNNGAALSEDMFSLDLGNAGMAGKHTRPGNAGWAY